MFLEHPKTIQNYSSWQPFCRMFPAINQPGSGPNRWGWQGEQFYPGSWISVLILTFDKKACDPWNCTMCNVADMIWYGQGVQQLHVPRVAGEHGPGRHPGHHLRLHLRPGRAPARGPGGGRGGGGAGADRAARQDQEVRHWQWHSCCSAHFNKMHWQSQKYFITEPNILIIFAISLIIPLIIRCPHCYDQPGIFACTAHAMLVNQIIVSNIFSTVSPECECCSC